MENEQSKVASIQIIIVLISVVLTVVGAKYISVNKVDEVAIVTSVLLGATSLFTSYLYIIYSSDSEADYRLYKASIFFDFSFIIMLFSSLLGPSGLFDNVGFKIGIGQMSPLIVPIVLIISFAVLISPISIESVVNRIGVKWEHPYKVKILDLYTTYGWWIACLITLSLFILFAQLLFV